MKKNESSYIRKWLWLFVLAVMLTTLIFYCLIYNQIDILLNGTAGMRIVPNGGLPGTAAELLAGLKMRIALLMMAGSLGVFFMSFLWLRIVARQIHRPILIIRRALFRLAQGRLNETVTLTSLDEFGQMGSKINELAANLQELLLCIWKQTGQCLTTLEELQGDSERRQKHPLPAQTMEQLKQLTISMENLREMAKAYVFYDVRLEGEQALAIGEPGQKKSASASSM